MRIYNRDQSAILGARNNRLAKMRAFSSSTKTRASSKGTTQSAPKSKNYRTSAWMQFLNQFQNGTAVSGDKIVENQKKSYDYEITGLAAERVETHMKRFLEEGEKSLYQEGEDAGKQLTKEMESFVSDYNMMIRKIGDLSDSVDETYAKKLKTEISARETALKQIGITLEKDGTLSFDKTVFQTVKPEAVQKIFGDKSTLSNRVQVLASGVKSNCRKQAAALLATSYMTSGNYSRYASDSNQTRRPAAATMRKVRNGSRAVKNKKVSAADRIPEKTGRKKVERSLSGVSAQRGEGAGGGKAKKPDRQSTARAGSAPEETPLNIRRIRRNSGVNPMRISWGSCAWWESGKPTFSIRLPMPSCGTITKKSWTRTVWENCLACAARSVRTREAAPAGRRSRKSRRLSLNFSCVPMRG